ncbi:Dolichol phosphate mannosyltransferase or dolichol phosphate beta glucosyltrandferase [Nitrospina gracilis 3/211]|uniref:Dolichol phosphate mannosyltransferase or dolichol phosphate beta glucosyltrandferase n=1 Tax=Nitrospina gracilis (strain 3/211) TaxID=1266370 RepID=M1Z1Y3_NITG3|nr:MULTISPECIES: glycosyltransferase family 2 protein [Nitrospina]MCF8724535.1 glycosyltransferase involved in cell wall biosynthesis [Nitrospina sp. Nb-3]CCQ91704.1 Dolichol phosphate mannosyltransferase or dolichol phosphate beta glucosyltrandferase [Nitrospina gracilis 3/211]
MSSRISVILPAFNEEQSIGLVLDDLPQDRLHQIIVVDNASTDATAEVARQHGATVVSEPRRGYGSACLKGIATLDHPDIVVFLDADYSDYPEEIDLLVQPIEAGEQDFVLGSRMLLKESRKALLPQARYGNKLAVFLIQLFFGHRYTDLGPFRAIRYASLMDIGMQDTNFGWTVEMQIKAVKKKLRILEVPVRYRWRVGVSKITGTVSGTFKAGTKIIYTIFKYLLT